VTTFVLGSATSVPLSLDFDGDGRADAVVYDASLLSWHIRLSGSGLYGNVGFGAPGFTPQG
jgi:hypothetical protein